jgi:hypothetical protein
MVTHLRTITTCILALSDVALVTSSMKQSYMQSAIRVEPAEHFRFANTVRGLLNR